MFWRGLALTVLGAFLSLKFMRNSVRGSMKNCPYCYRKVLLPDYKFCPYCGWQFDNNTPSAEFDLGRAAFEKIKPEIWSWIKRRFSILSTVIAVLGALALFFGDDYIGRIASQKVTDQLDKRLSTEINQSVKDRMGEVSLQLYSLIDIFPVMEREFYRFDTTSIRANLNFTDRFHEEIFKLNVCKSKLNTFITAHSYIVNEKKKLILNVQGIKVVEDSIKKRYDGYKYVNEENANYESQLKILTGSISDILEGSTFLEYILIVDAKCDKDKWNDIAKEVLPQKIHDIIFSLNKSGLFTIFVNRYKFLSIDISNIELGEEALHIGRKSKEIYSNAYIGKREIIEDKFKYGTDIRKAYREALLKN